MNSLILIPARSASLFMPFLTISLRVSVIISLNFSASLTLAFLATIENTGCKIPASYEPYTSSPIPASISAFLTGAPGALTTA